MYQEDGSERNRLLGIMRDNPGCTRQQLARLSGVPAEEIHGILGADLHMLVQEGERAVSFSDEDIKEALLRGAELAGEPLTVAGYELVRDQFGGLSPTRVIQRFTSWAMACEFAEVRHGKPRRAEYKRRWTDAEMLEWAVVYFDSEGCQGTYKDFSRWAANTPEAPSAQTVRNRLGSWTIVKRAALAHAEAPDVSGGDSPDSEGGDGPER